MKILIAGDYCPQARVSQIIAKGDGENVFADIIPYVNDADYSIVNFECAVVDKHDKPIVKFGPCLSCTSDGVNLLKTVGFDCVTLANNHFRDFGNVGVKKSLQAMRAIGIDFVGGGESIEEAEKVLYKDINGETLAVVNFCENEFSIATREQGGSAPMNPVKNYYQIVEAKQNSDFVIVIIHGGHEGYQYPSPRMKQLYRWYVDLGANVVVNGHQHCFSGYEWYKDAPIIYGLGNFCFDEDGSRNDLWNYGYFLRLSIERNKIDFECVPYEQCNDAPVVRLLQGEEKKDFESQLSEINAIINDEEKFEAHHTTFCDSKKGYLSCITPYLSDYARAAACRGWLPSLLPKKKKLNILNFIECESHRDMLIESIKKHIYYDKKNR
ncbi:MAG: CapA family protein [Bacteroidales bacterium]|nr:CapA family protein [Bacteroidales bacterium]